MNGNERKAELAARRRVAVAAARAGGLTLQQIATTLGVSRQRVHLILAGKRRAVDERRRTA